MTTRQCVNKSGLPSDLCEAFVKAGLTVSQISVAVARDFRGWTNAELTAINKYYVTPDPPMPDCGPDCAMCHPEILKRK